MNPKNQLLSGLENIPDFAAVEYKIFTSSLEEPSYSDKRLAICVTATVLEETLNRIVLPYRIKIEVEFVLPVVELILPSWARTIEILRYGVASAFIGDRTTGWREFSNADFGNYRVMLTRG